MNRITERAIKDANEAVASVAYKFSEMIAIYPITPSSPMAEWCDQWATEGKKNLWGVIPEVVEMQSEAGAAGTVHGSLQGGVLTTTFTASQGLLLMIPNLYKIAGELTPFCMHVTARALATHGLSIFGDHSDVMATRQTGMALLSSQSVQAAHDLAAIAHAATLKASVPFIHFFDGFRTSHEINTYYPINEDVLKALIDDADLFAFRKRGLTPDDPVIRGTAQNPDVYFQGRERSNCFYQNLPAIVDEKMRLFEKLTRRRYHLFDYEGDPEAECVFVIMGSGSETIRQVIQYKRAQGKKVGVLTVHLYRPFSTEFFLKALPVSAEKIVVFDRTKEPGSVVEPLCQDVQSVLQEAYHKGLRKTLPVIIGGRYGLGSKEFTPAMVNAVYEAACSNTLPNSFTVGIEDDITHLSVPVKKSLDLEDKDCFRAVFYGLGSDGTVGANKNTIKIIGNETDQFVQAYFVYDSKKSGAMTVSHLRFGPNPIQAPYLIQTSNFVACHQFQFINNYDVLKTLQKGGIFLLNTPNPSEVWGTMPQEVQQTLIDKNVQFYAIDAYEVARNAGMGGRINTIMQTCFFAISGILPKEEAISYIKNAIKKTYGKKGESVVQSNCAAVDATLAHLHKIDLQPVSMHSRKRVPLNLSGAPEFIQKVTKTLLEQKGDTLPVSAFPENGTWPTGTTRFEKRDLAQFIPEWDPSIWIQCNRCSTVCPHAAIRAKHYPKAELDNAPEGFKSAAFRSKDYPNDAFTIQVSPADCTGCGLCSEVCPAKNKLDANKKALTMVRKNTCFEEADKAHKFFEKLPWPDTQNDKLDAKNTQFRQPLFEYSGACAGCGETAYIKMLTQLFGDHLILANATGCSSIYGGNLPTTPYTKNADGRGPAWANSLFEDNAEFGFGLKLSSDKKSRMARELLTELKPELKGNFDDLLIQADTDAQRVKKRQKIETLKNELQALSSEKANLLLSLADFLIEKTIWTVGGDGWAYDIGFGGLDHVLASGHNVNVLVLDTEVYSNTGGQQSKSTPLGAVTKFAAAGKERNKKDLALLAMTYGNIYVAQIALQANPTQAVKALVEANSYQGPSLIIAYSNCIEHGYDLRLGAEHQRLAVESGYWPLFRYDPRTIGRNPLQLDAVDTKVPLSDYLSLENRFKVLAKSNPERAAALMEKAQAIVNQRIALYKRLGQ